MGFAISSLKKHIPICQVHLPVSFVYILPGHFKELTTSVAFYKKSILTIFLHVCSLNTELIMQFPKKIRIRLNTMFISPSSNCKLYTSKPITHSSLKAKSKLIDSSQAKSYDQKLKGARIMFQVQPPK